MALDAAAIQHPDAVVWGGADAGLARLFRADPSLPRTQSEPFTEFLVRRQNREIVLGLLLESRNSVVQELMDIRKLTNTSVFTPSISASGQALDTALSTCGLLIEGNCLTTNLAQVVGSLASAANRGKNSQPIEQVLLDFMSLGQRFTWGQLVAFVDQVEDAETLRLLTGLIRNQKQRIPLIFAAVQLSGNPAGVARFLVDYGKTGPKDLAASIHFGAGGVTELVKRNQRLYTSRLHPHIAVVYCWRTPRLALGLKWILYLAGGYLIGVALHFARPKVSELERPLQVRGFHIAREILFGMGFLVAVLLLSEPFLAQDYQKVDFPLKLRLPTAGSAALAVRSGPVASPVMNEVIILTLLLFFVLQGLLYTASLLKLAEIKRQPVSARVKLKLLENEDHLFDAGLYLGFAGTIISLILVSMGVIRPSLMAAYSSTSFGIVFVSVFKICHLRPQRRRLLLEAEENSASHVAPTATPSLALPS
jgi:hypothetical protein